MIEEITLNSDQKLRMIACHRTQIQALKLQRNEECKLIKGEQHDLIAKTYNAEIKYYQDDIKELQSKL